MTSRLSRPASINLVLASRCSFTFFPMIVCNSRSTFMLWSRDLMFMLARVGRFCDEDGVQSAEGEARGDGCVTGQLHVLQSQRQVACRTGAETTQHGRC